MLVDGCTMTYSREGAGATYSDREITIDSVTKAAERGGKG